MKKTTWEQHKKNHHLTEEEYYDVQREVKE